MGLAVESSGDDAAVTARVRDRLMRERKAGSEKYIMIIFRLIVILFFCLWFSRIILLNGKILRRSIRQSPILT